MLDPVVRNKIVSLSHFSIPAKQAYWGFGLQQMTKSTNDLVEHIPKVRLFAHCWRRALLIIALDAHRIISSKNWEVRQIGNGNTRLSFQERTLLRSKSSPSSVANGLCWSWLRSCFDRDPEGKKVRLIPAWATVYDLTNPFLSSTESYRRPQQIDRWIRSGHSRMVQIER